MARALGRLRELVEAEGGGQPRVLRTHYASLGAPDLVFDQEAADLAAVDASVAELKRRQANTSRAIGELDGDAAAPLIAGLRRLSAHRRALETERAGLLARRAAWSAAQATPTQIEAWCKGMVGEFAEELTYAERRTVLAVLDVRVTIYRASHTPHYPIIALVGLAHGDSSGTTPATVPSATPPPKTCIRSDC